MAALNHRRSEILGVVHTLNGRFVPEFNDRIRRYALVVENGAKDNSGVPTTPSVPSDSVILERALNFANDAMFTLDLQWRRIHTDEPEDARFPMRIWSDLSFFIVTLQRLRRSATLACSVAAVAVELRHALADFDHSVPMLKVMRDVGEHIDDYALERGRRHHRHVTRAFLQVARWDGTAYTWLGVTLNLGDARAAAQVLYDAMRRVTST